MGSTIQPDRILRELGELWASFGKQEDQTSSAVLRACSMTLIVVAEADEDANIVGETLAALMRDHPSRVIVVRVHGGRDAGPDSALEARVFAQCWMPVGQRQQICCEQIEITASDATLEGVPAVVLSLVVADLPVILWCRIPRLIAAPAFTQLSSIATKLIIDSRTFTEPRVVLLKLAEAVASGRLLADLTWTRITRWRETIAQIFENTGYFALLPSIAEVRITHAGSAPPVSASYLAAWLRLCLEKTGSRPRLRFERGDEDVGGAIHRVEFSSGDPSIFNVSVSRVDGSVAEVRVNALVNRTVFPELSEYVLLREELSIPGRDVIFESSLALAAKLAKARQEER